MDDIAMAQTSGRVAFLTPDQKVTPIEGRHDLYEISGNSYSILYHVRKVRDLQKYPYLKINVMGSQTKDFSYGCLYFLIGMIVFFFFPIFLLCSDCCKRRIYTLFNINLDVYQAIGTIIAEMKPRECFIVIQDNYFNEAKCNAIGRGLQQSYTEKLQLVNISAGINTYGHNFSDFKVYGRQLKNYVRQSRCKWGSQSV